MEHIETCLNKAPWNLLVYSGTCLKRALEHTGEPVYMEHNGTCLNRAPWNLSKQSNMEPL